MNNDTNVYWHENQVSRAKRENLKGHRGCVVWFTGLSGSGKSTVANIVDYKLYERGIHSVVLDGDNVRHALNAGPGMLKQRHSEEFAARLGQDSSCDSLWAEVGPDSRRRRYAHS